MINGMRHAAAPEGHLENVAQTQLKLIVQNVGHVVHEVREAEYVMGLEVQMIKFVVYMIGVSIHMIRVVVRVIGIVGSLINQAVHTI